MLMAVSQVLVFSKLELEKWWSDEKSFGEQPPSAVPRMLLGCYVLCRDRKAVCLGWFGHHEQLNLCSAGPASRCGHCSLWRYERKRWTGSVSPQPAPLQPPERWD